MQMLNVSALITGYDTVGDHTEFIVEISCNGGLWRISRRFSDFDQLHARLVQRFGDLIEVSLPEKQWFGRFDPNFLVKRQASLQEYLDGLLQVPGILDDASLQHFLELEQHLGLNGDLGRDNGSNDRGSSKWPRTDPMSENDRLSGIVESAAQAFIDISEVPEPLEAEQAVQRKNEIVTASQSLLDEQQLAKQFAEQLTTLRLPRTSKQPTSEEILTRLEAGNDDGLSYEQEQEFLASVLESAETSLHMTISPPAVDLFAAMGSSPPLSPPAALPSNGSLSNGSGMGLESGAALEELGSASVGSNGVATSSFS